MAPNIGAESASRAALQELFDGCNARYFNGVLSPSPGFTLRYSNAERWLSRFRASPVDCRDLAIELSARLQDHPRALRSAMVRAMIFMLAHQSYRETGDATFLDREPLYGHLFIEPGIGAFFLAQLDHLNQAFPELGLTIKPRFGSGSLFEQSRIPATLLVLINVETANDTGVIYRLHPKASLDWAALRELAWQHHGTPRITVLKVSGALAEAYPRLRRDNAPKRSGPALAQEDFALLVKEISDHRLTAELLPPDSDAMTEATLVWDEQLPVWRPATYSGY